MNQCIDCGCERHPVAIPGRCQSCRNVYLSVKNKAKALVDLDARGFDFIRDLDGRVDNKRNVEVRNRECGHTFDAQLNNLISGRTRCGVCGPVKRIANAAVVYKKMFGRTYDVKKWEDYKNRAWEATMITYRANMKLLNPNNYPRYRGAPNQHHIDHIVPMIEGFKRQLPVELLGSLENLRVVLATANLRKKQKLTEEAEAMLTRWSRTIDHGLAKMNS